MAGSNGRAKRHFFGGTGLYIALFLGVTALAVAGYWTLLPKNTTDKDAENVSSQVELPVQDETPQMPEAELPQEAAKPAEPVEEPPEDLIVMDEATGVEDTVPAMESETDAQPVAPRLVVAPLQARAAAPAHPRQRPAESRIMDQERPRLHRQRPHTRRRPRQFHHLA